MLTNTLRYPHPTPKPGTALQIAPGIHWLRMALPWSLNHINLWLLDDDDGVCLIDTGLGDAPSREALSRLLAGQRPLRKIVATHYHPDHLGNAEWLSSQFEAPVWMATGEFLLAHALYHELPAYGVEAMLAHFRHHGLDETRLGKLAARGNVYRRGVPELPTSHERLAHGDMLRIGADTWQCIGGLGHSPEHMALYCADRKLLLSGDMLLPRITPNIAVGAAAPHDDAVGRFLASIDRFASLPADTLVLPAHGSPFTGLHVRIGQLHAHHAERDATILSALSVPRSAAELLEPLFRRELDSHQLMFAMSETIAHLNHLWHRQAANRTVHAGGLIRFQTTAGSS